MNEDGFVDSRSCRPEKSFIELTSPYEHCVPAGSPPSNKSLDTHQNPSFIRSSPIELGLLCAMIQNYTTSTRIVQTQACTSSGPQPKRMRMSDALHHRTNVTSVFLALVRSVRLIMEDLRHFYRCEFCQSTISCGAPRIQSREYPRLVGQARNARSLPTGNSQYGRWEVLQDKRRPWTLFHSQTAWQQSTNANI